MALQTARLTLELTPAARLDLINVNQRIAESAGDFFARFKQVLYCSHHTTAGYLEQNVCERFGYNPDSIRSYIESFQSLFPPNADYLHDHLELRTELSEEQKRDEPLNADSHLTFIGSGLSNCVTYQHPLDAPVYFIDLDGIFRETRRKRQTTVFGFDQEVFVRRMRFDVPVSNHPIDSVSLKDERVGLFDEIREVIQACGIRFGRVDIALASDEKHTGLTVNEYETLLMKHDLAEVLRDPFRFMAEKGRHMLRDPRAIPGKMINYAKYDMVHVINEFLDALHLSGTVLEKAIDKFLAFPAERCLRMKRSVSLPVSEIPHQGCSTILEGTYQSPVMVQWRRTEKRVRKVNVDLFSFE